MTADGTYSPKTYRRQGGNVFVIASTGQLLVESGGGINVESGGNITNAGTQTISSGGGITVASGGNITVADGGQILNPVVTETTAAALANYGVSIVTRGTTATGANNYTMDPPVAGTMKWITCTTANTSDCVTISGNTNVTYANGVTQTTLKIIREGTVGLMGLSTSAWSIVGGSTVYAFATS